MATLTDIRTVSYANQQIYNSVSGMKDISYNPSYGCLAKTILLTKTTARFNGFLRFTILEGLTAEVGINWAWQSYI
ncbi:MAG: hypothetical protein ACLUVG_08510 [Phocaeicola vulgatus]